MREQTPFEPTLPSTTLTVSGPVTLLNILKKCIGKRTWPIVILFTYSINRQDNYSQESRRPLSEAYNKDSGEHPAPRAQSIYLFRIITERNVYDIPQKKRRSKWLTVGLPCGLIVIAGAVVGVLFGLKIIKTGGSSSSSSSSSGGSGGNANVDLENLSYFATATNSYHQPLYPSMVRVYYSSFTEIELLLMLSHACFF